MAVDFPMEEAIAFTIPRTVQTVVPAGQWTLSDQEGVLVVNGRWNETPFKLTMPADGPIADKLRADYTSGADLPLSLEY